MLWPNFMAPSKNSTLLTAPSKSEALAAIVILAGAVKVAFSPGLVMETVGGLLAPTPVNAGLQGDVAARKMEPKQGPANRESLAG